MKSGSVECLNALLETSWVFSKLCLPSFHFPKMNKGWVGIKAGGGWKLFQKLISGGGDDYSVLESIDIEFDVHFLLKGTTCAVQYSVQIHLLMAGP